MQDITIQRKRARDERRKRDSELKDLKTDNSEERGAVGQAPEKRDTGSSGSLHKVDLNSMPPLPFGMISVA